MGSKYKRKLLIFIILISILIIGCSNIENTKSSSNININDNNEQYTIINPNKVDWITMVGGLHITTKALFKENSKDKIMKVISLINKGANQELATEAEKSYIQSDARPIGIKIKLQDGSMNYIYPSPKRVKDKEGWGITSRDDKFVLVTNKDGVEKYYSFTSSEVPEYLREFQEDMPKVKPFVITPYKVKLGDNVKISGDGCTEQEVKIYLVKSPNEKYLLGVVKPQYGKWLWEGKIERTFTPLKGEKVTLGKGEYSLSANFGVSTVGSGYLNIKD